MARVNVKITITDTQTWLLTANCSQPSCKIQLHDSRHYGNSWPLQTFLFFGWKEWVLQLSKTYIYKCAMQFEVIVQGKKVYFQTLSQNGSENCSNSNFFYFFFCFDTEQGNLHQSFLPWNVSSSVAKIYAKIYQAIPKKFVHIPLLDQHSLSSTSRDQPF